MILMIFTFGAFRKQMGGETDEKRKIAQIYNG
jgi:hypothetical protein